MAHPVGPNEMRLICSRDLDCNSKIINSFCDRNSSCACDRGYRYYRKFNKCVFGNHFHCSSVQQCANLDPRLTCLDSYCTCKEKEKRTDNYLCSSFKKYCYRGYRYNVETTDCVFVGDLTANQLENLDQSVEIFVIVLFFITSALFIASCINNYKNERAEKLRRRLARQQTMNLFEQQRRRIDLGNSPPVAGMITLTNENLYASHNQQLRNGPSRQSHSLSMSQNRNFRHPHLMDYHKAINMGDYEDLPPSYDEVMKNEDNSKLYLNPLANTVVTLNGQLDSQTDGRIDGRSTDRPFDQLDAHHSDDVQLSVEHAERGAQSTGSTHQEPVSDTTNHSASSHPNSNDSAGSNGCDANKAASNCHPNDSSASWNGANNNDPNNNHSLAVR